MSHQLAERRDLRQLVQSDRIKEQLALALPKYYSAEQFAVIIRTQINKNPKLQECTEESFLVACLTAAQMGIAPDGRNGYLIPQYNKKTQCLEVAFRPDYKGIIGLVRKSENVADIYAEAVYDTDTFKITKGLHRDLIHEVDITKEQGKILGFYAVISYKDGTNASFDFMTLKEVEAIRKRSQSPDSGPWVTDFVEMGKKTILRRLMKLADLTPDTVDRMDRDPERTTIEIQPASVPARETLPEATKQALPERTPEPSIAAEDTTNATPPGEPIQAPSSTSADPSSEMELLPPEKAQQPEPAAKPEKKTPAKPALTPEPVATGESQLLTEIRAGLEKAGYTEADLLQVCIAEKVMKEGQPLSSASDSIQKQILQFWPEISKSMASNKAK